MSINTPAHYIYEPDQWPAKYPPRPYLCAAIVHSLEAVDAGQRGIVHLPTGTGKTIKAAKVTQHYHSCEPSTHRRVLNVCYPSTDRPDEGQRRPILVSSSTGAGSAILPKRANRLQWPC